MKTIYGIKKYEVIDKPFVCFESYQDAYEFAESYDPGACTKLIVPIPCVENTARKPQDALGAEIRRLSDKLAERDRDRGLNGKDGTE